MRNLKLNILTFALALSAVANAQIDRSKAPEPGAAPKINIPEPAKFELANGLKVFVIENHKLPQVSIQLSLDIPPMLEGDKVGLSSIAGDLMGAGTTKHTKSEIDEQVDFIGADFTTTGGGVYASGLSKHTDKLLDLMSEVILYPAFPEEELEKQKKRELSGLKSLASNADAIAGRVQSSLLYGKNHPYGEVQIKEHVENIGIEDCKNYYNTYFRPNIGYLVMIGDIKVEDAKQKIEKYFGTWEKKDVPTIEMPAVKNPEGVNVVFVEKPGAVQSVVKVIYPVDLPQGSKDASANLVMNGIFGGAFSSRLNMNLREAHGYTYGARGSVRADRYIGSFSAGASVRNEVTDSTVAEILKEMNSIIKDGVTKEELDRNKNFNNGKFALSLESSQTVARFALSIEKYGLPSDYYQNYLSRLAAVTGDDVKASAKKYIRPNNCYVLVVGSADVVENLKQFDTDGQIDMYDKNGDVQKEKKELPEGLTAQQVINDYLMAYTQTNSIDEATKKLKGVKGYSMKSEAKIQGMTMEINVKKAKKNKHRDEMKMSGATMSKTIFDGKKGGYSGMQKNGPMTDEEIASYKSQFLHQELYYGKLGYELTLLSVEDFEGKDAYAVNVKDADGRSTVMLFDVESKLKVQATATEEIEGEVHTMVSQFSDYKEMGGLMVPGNVYRDMGMIQFDMKLKDFKVNPKFDKKTFKYSGPKE